MRVVIQSIDPIYIYVLRLMQDLQYLLVLHTIHDVLKYLATLSKIASEKYFITNWSTPVVSTQFLQLAAQYLQENFLEW